MENIKNILKSKVTVVALACLLLVGVFAGITALATESTPETSITAINVNHGGDISLVYEVKIENIDSFDENLFTMKFWSYEPSSAGAEAQTVATEAELKHFSNNTATVWVKSVPFAPKDMSKRVYAVADYAGNCSEIKAYSVLEYLCEATLDANADQKALYATMRSYIDYAREYLGWTEGDSAKDYGYVDVVGGYILVGTKTADNKYSYDYNNPRESGLFKIGSILKVVSDYPIAKWTNASGAPMNLTGLDDQYNAYEFSLTASDSIRRYTAYPATLVSMATPGYELAYIKVTTNDGVPAYALQSYHTSESTSEFLVSQCPAELFCVSAPLYNEEGAMFSHWEKDGEILTTSTLLDISAEVDYSKEHNAYEVTATPKYEATPDRTYAFNSGYIGGGTYDKYTELDNGWIYDSTSRPSNNPSGAGMRVTGTSNDATITGASKVVFSMNVKYESATGATANLTMGDLFSAYTNPVMNQLRVGYGDAKYSYLYAYFTANRPNGTASAATTEVNGYHVSICKNSSGHQMFYFNADPRFLLKYGETYNITFIVDSVKSADGKYTQDLVSCYIDGIYAGSARAIPDDGSSNPYTYGSTQYINLHALMRSKTKVTITDVKSYEFAD